MRYILILIACFPASLGFSQDVLEYPMKESALLWQITGDKVEDTSYLFGTMHMIDSQFFLFPETLNEKIIRSDMVMLEVSEEPNPVELVELMMLKEGRLLDFFDKKQKKRLLTWVEEEMKVDSEMFEFSFGKMKPFTLVALATQMSMPENTESYEEEIIEIATVNNIEMSGLETFAEQMSFFDEFTMEEQAAMVMEAIDQDDEAKNMLVQMQKTYANQQVDSLFLMIQDEGGTFSEQQEVLLDSRNSRWIPKIQRMIAEEKTFIGVGAGHLGGPNGVIRLLQKEGYTLTPIRL